jgi:hypothetical protein
MASVTAVPLDAHQVRPGKSGRRVLLILAALAAVSLLLLASFQAGEHRGRQMTIMTGLGSGVGEQGEIESGGLWYGVNGLGSVVWVNSTGGTVDSGWPTCLNQARAVRLTFGWVPVTFPNGLSMRKVVWVDCQS